MSSRLVLLIATTLSLSGCVRAQSPAVTHAQQENRGSPASPPPSLALGSSPAGTPEVAVAPLTELTSLPLGERVGAYAASDAQWVAGLPVSVNRDFDFAAAFAIETVGAGIAAAKRRAGNADFAQRLSKLDRFEARSLLQAVCARRPTACTTLAASGVRVYALLFGEREARLRVMLETVSADARMSLFASISAARSGATFADAGALRAVFESELTRVVGLLDLPAGDPSAGEGECAAGDGLRMRGRLVARDEQRVVLLTSDPKTLVSCPADAFSFVPRP